MRIDATDIKVRGEWRSLSRAIDKRGNPVDSLLTAHRDHVARSPEKADRQARGESVTEREAFNFDDLGLEIGQALAAAGEVADDRAR